jgi:protein ImuA
MYTSCGGLKKNLNPAGFSACLMPKTGYRRAKGLMTDSARQIFERSPIRTITLQRLAAQLEKMEKARGRSIPHPGSSSDLGFRESPSPHPAAPESQLPEKGISTGVEALDRLLPDAGFRKGTLVEWLAEAGSGDQLALLAAAPALVEDRPLFVIDGEATFYPPAAAALGIDLSRLVLVRPRKAARATTTGAKTAAKTAVKKEAPNDETLWALEQTLQSRGVAVTFCRLERMNARVFRRLQLAVERGGGVGFLIRAPSARSDPSWSDVRLSVEAVPATFSPGKLSLSGRRWRVEVLRCRRGAAGQRSIVLEFNDATHTLHPIADPRETSTHSKRARRA